MPTHINHPQAGTNADDARRQAFALIRDLEAAIKQRNDAPAYLAGPDYDPEENFADVIENTEPWDRVAELQDSARANPVVVQILTAQNRLRLLSQ